MKHQISIYSVLITLIFISNSIFAQQYAVKSGHVEYQLSGNTIGTKSLWWDDYGAKTRTEIKATTVTKMFGITNEEKEHKVTIAIKEQNWTANLIENTGMKSVNEYYNMGVELAESLSEAEKKELEERVLASLNGEKLGTEKVLGKNCDVFSVMGGKAWIYKGLSLKSEVSVMGIKNHEEAIKFEENIAIPTSKFKPIEGIDYEDLQAQQQAYYQEMYGEEYEDESDEEENIPVSYPFDKFNSVINGFSHTGYSKIMCRNMEGNHMAMFTKAMVNSITIVASSEESFSDADKNAFESFKHNGRTCWYGNLEGDDEGTAVLVEYPEHEMCIVIAGTPYLSKEELIKISDKLKF